MTTEEFQTLLERSLERESVAADEVQAVYASGAAFWRDHLGTYLEGPQRYESLLALYHRLHDLYPREPTPSDPARFEEQIETFRRFDARNTVPTNAVLFVGSSSIVFWETATAFPNHPVINRGFGGSTLSDVNHYYDDVLTKYDPATVVLYCDNDIFTGRSPDATLELFKTLTGRITEDLPQTKILVLSMKPSPIDDIAGPHVRTNIFKANDMFRDFIASQENMRFVDVATPMVQNGQLQHDIFLDGNHLNEKGYRIWNTVMTKELSELHPSSRAVAANV